MLWFGAQFSQVFFPLGSGVGWADRLNFQEGAVATAVLVMLIGMRLCWRAPRHRMSMEERAKDGKLTGDQARRKIRLMGWFGPGLILAGVVVLGAGLLY